MSIHSYLAFFSGGLAVTYILFSALYSKQSKPLTWMFPAAISLLFLCFSVFSIIQEGPLGFWYEHTRNFWGNQIWFDLLIAVGIGWTLLLPLAKELKMNLVIWAVIVLSTGCIGLSAMLARALYLKHRDKVNLGRA